MSSGGGGAGYVEDRTDLETVLKTEYTYTDTADLHTRVMVRDANAGYHTTDTTFSTRAVFTDVNTETFLTRFAKDYPTYSTNSNYATGLASRNDDNGNTVIVVNTSGGDEIEIGRGWVTNSEFVALMSAWGITINMAPNYGTVVYYTDDTYTTTESVTIPEYETVLEMGNEQMEIAGVVVHKNSIKQVVLTNLVTEIPTGFLSGSTHLETVDISSTSITTVPSSFCSSCIILNSDIILPPKVTSIGNSFLMDCDSFNSKISMPDTVTSIGDYFLMWDTAFNQPLSISTSLTTIGLDFMYHCQSFNQNITFPNTVTSYGTYFMSDCRAMVGSVNIGSTAPRAYTDRYTFSAMVSSAPCYTTGITIKGSNRAAWISKYPNLSSGSSYRKLIDGGE